MDKETKIEIGIYIFISIAILVIVVIVLKNNIPKKNEPYTYVGSSNNLLLSDNNGNMSLYKTNNGTLLFTDESGRMKSLPFPKGMIIIWSGSISDIPAGWSLCDGGTYNGYLTPDLRGKFVLSAGQGGSLSDGTQLSTRNVGNDGGKEKVGLETEEMPRHSHRSDHPQYYAAEPVSGSPNSIFGTTGSTTSYGTWGVIDVAGGQSDGTTKAHENMPPFYVLCYICYTGNGLTN